MSETTQAPATCKMVCMGMRFYNDELSQHWRPLPNGEPMAFGKPLVTYARPGQVFEFYVAKTDEAGKVTSVYSSGKYAPTYVQAPDCFEPGSEVLDWVAAHELAKVRHGAYVAGKRMAKEGDPLRALCAPLRRELAKRKDWGLRSALLEAIKMELNRPYTKAEQAGE